MKKITIEISECEAESLISVLQHEHEALSELVIKNEEYDFMDQLCAVHNTLQQLKEKCEVS